MLPLENKIVIATQMLAKSRAEDRPQILKSIYERFGLDCEVIYIQALSDTNNQMRISAINILADLLQENSIKYVEKHKEDKSFWVRRAVKKCYKKLDK